MTYGVEQRASSSMVTDFKEEISDLEIVEGLLPRLSPETIKTLRILAEQLLKSK